MIRRPDYVDAILPFVDAPLVKILSGVRRCGKSTILEMMKEELLNRGIKAENIIGRNYASVEYGEAFLAKDMDALRQYEQYLKKPAAMKQVKERYKDQNGKTRTRVRQVPVGFPGFETRIARVCGVRHASSFSRSA